MRRIKKIIFLLMIIPMSSYAQPNNIGPGISLEFDGVAGNYVDIGDVYNTLNFPFTIETWLYPTSLPPLVAGIMASDNDNIGNYYGFYLTMTISGKIMLEIGDGTGAGSTDRRGKVTTSAMPLNTWTHLSVVATSVTDMKFYFNGILQPAVNTDGSSTATSLVHTSKVGTIGRIANVHSSHPFIGFLDDVRLWNVSRSETEVRSNMCHKLLGTETGLIGYWNADESYASLTVNDLTAPAENGTVTGIVNKVTSSAPIGDVSVYQYVADWSGVTLSLTSPGGDKLKVNKILNTPSGVHLYRVNTSPYFTGNLDVYTNYYYGVFSADGALAAKYTVTYLYSVSNGAVTIENEPDAALFAKNDASKPNWTDAGATLNITSDKLTKKNINSRKEFIFNVINAVSPRMENVTSDILIYPNPASETIMINNLKNGDRIRITDLSGQIAREVTCDAASTLKIDISDLTSGIYIATVYSAGEISSVKFIVSDH